MKFRYVSKDYREKTVIKIGRTALGRDFTIIAGPCAIENREQLMNIAGSLKKIGVDILRGGAYKPRTSPYTFQGIGLEGLKILREVGDRYNLPVVTEALDIRTLDKVIEYVDIIQIGARNMYNYPLLKEVGKCNKPIILKRGLSATLEEWLYAAEYIMNEGNEDIILCERGIRTFTKHTRFTLDIAVVPSIKEISHLPIIIDPSHPSGRRDIVTPLARAAACVGADGIMVEVHNNPDIALSDAKQSLTIDMYRRLVEEIRRCLR
jgi:3-deoxy-7-phosphoheptulonate synthase